MLFSGASPYVPGLDGALVIEAESYEQVFAGVTHQWEAVADPAASGGVKVLAGPNLEARLEIGQSADSPRLDYTVYFSSTVTYDVWVRRLADNSDDKLAG